MAGGKQQRKAKKKGGNTKASLSNGNRRNKNNNKNKISKVKPMTTLPDECLANIVEFLDFDSLLAYRSTSKAQQGAAESELMRRAVAVLPLTRETKNDYFGSPRTCKMTLSSGWSERWTTREGLVETAMKHAKPAGYFNDEGEPESEMAKAQRENNHKKMLLRTAKAQVYAGAEEYWSVNIPDRNQKMTRPFAWEKVADCFEIFGLGMEFNNDFDPWNMHENPPFFGPEDDSEARAYLTPLVQAFGGLLVQAKTEASSLVAFSRIAFQEETDYSSKDGEECVILFRTKDGERFQLEFGSTTYAQK